MQIKYIDRETNKIEKEKVAGELYLRWIYENPVGTGFLELFFKRKIFSYIYGKLQDTFLSKGKIPEFIREFNIDSTEFEKKIEEFKSFNDFFTRKIKKEARPIDTAEDRLIAVADGRLMAYENIDIDNLIQIKGFTYSLKELIGDEIFAQKFQKGVCVIIRLCPSDYHRFHFPDEGYPEKCKEINGNYYSVNPIALYKKAKLYCRNKRNITLFHSRNFGDILLVEVGATCVGSIVQTYTPQLVKKGEEKGYFKFGGSTVLMFLMPGKIQIDADLLRNTAKGLETKVKMGMGIGTKIN